MIKQTIYIFSLLFCASVLSLSIPAIVFSQQAPPEARKITNFWQPGDSGERLYIDGRVLDESGRPLAGAIIKVWQADGDGNYHDDRYRGIFTTAADGGYAFGTVVPGQYYSAKHIHMIVSHDNYPPVQTDILFKGDPNLSEEQDRKQAIFLEEAQAKGEKVMFGRFDITLRKITE